LERPSSGDTLKILARGENKEEHFEPGMTRLVGNLVRC